MTQIKVSLNWDEYIAYTREWLEHYPETIFTGISGDPGALFIVAVRKALKDLDDEDTPAA